MDELHLSYSGLWAKKYLTDTLKCQFMCLDKGDDAEEASRTEDSEPLPATIDPWAQGCLPVVRFTREFAHVSPQEDEGASHQVQVRSSWPTSNKLTSSLLLTNKKGTSSDRPFPIVCSQRQQVQKDQVQVPTVSSEKKPSNASVLCLTNSSLPTEKQKTTMKHTRETQLHRISLCPPQKPDPKKKQGANLFPKADANKLLPPISHSSERKDVEGNRKSMEQAALKPKNVSGNYLKESKRLDPLCLPQKWICPQYEILENIHTKQRPSRETRQESKLSKDWDLTAAPLKPLTSSSNQMEKMNLKYAHLSKHEKEPNMTSNVERLSKTVLAKGVSLIDSPSVEINTQTCERPTELTKLKPIQNHPTVPLLSVKQVAKASPQVNSLFQSYSVTSSNDK